MYESVKLAPQGYVGSNPTPSTDWDFPRGEEAKLSAPAPAESFAKGSFRFAKNWRSFKKKVEPTVFAMIDKSWQLFFSRAILAHDSALLINSLKGSNYTEPFALILEICS